LGNKRAKFTSGTSSYSRLSVVQSLGDLDLEALTQGELQDDLSIRQQSVKHLKKKENCMSEEWRRM